MKQPIAARQALGRMGMMACMGRRGEPVKRGEQSYEGLVTNKRDEMIMCTLGDNRPWDIGGASCVSAKANRLRIKGSRADRGLRQPRSSRHRADDVLESTQTQSRRGAKGMCSGSSKSEWEAMWSRNAELHQVPNELSDYGPNGGFSRTLRKQRASAGTLSRID